MGAGVLMKRPKAVKELEDDDWVFGGHERRYGSYNGKEIRKLLKYVKWLERKAGLR